MAKKRTEPKHFPCIVCGRQIGTTSGWDQSDTFEILFYDFTPTDGYTGPVSADSITINFGTGLLKTYDREGNLLDSRDLIEVINAIPHQTV